MRVLHFMPEFSGLAQTFVYDMVVELERLIGDQHVAAMKRVNRKEREFPRVHVVKSPTRLHPLVIWNRVVVAARARPPWTAHWPVVRSRLEKVISTVQPDVVHAHFGTAGVMVAPVARKAGLPLVTSFHGADASKVIRDPVWKGLYQQEVFTGARVVSVSNIMSQHLISAGLLPNKASVIHVGKDYSAYPFSPSVRIRRFLSVGRMTEKKGPLDAVAAFAKACARFRDARLDMVGGGYMLGPVQDLVKSLEIGDRVTVHGPLEHERVQELLLESDAFLLASKRAADGDSEGMPTVLLEAQGCGLPCVATFHSGIPEGIPEPNQHLLAPEGDVDGLAERLIWLMEAEPEEIRTIAARGRAHAEREYRLTTEARKLTDLYAECIEGAGFR